MCPGVDARSGKPCVWSMQASFVIPEGATFLEYLSLRLPEDEATDIPLSLKSMQASSSKMQKDSSSAVTTGTQVPCYGTLLSLQETATDCVCATREEAPCSFQ